MNPLMEEEVPVRCGCADFIVPPWKLLDKFDLFPVKSEEVFHIARHQDAGPRGSAGRDVLKGLENSLHSHLQHREARG
ncbi:hypothetical protein KUCAC02_021780 [Chaenocephalus aceratus]|uniref:Uncharacterized protein n=1 Tax=Chaenocephalus aceratus TaxID=36190 RepID=A0ACB9XIH8_CHAAC|nr:hypothetical protein KUCAC02_021780 [Chaenocephalus aceratus]